MRVKFDLTNFPKVMNKMYYEMDMPYDEGLRSLGYKSAQYHPSFSVGDNEPHHSMEEDEYTWFVLRWS